MWGLIHFLKCENYLKISIPGRWRPLTYRGTKKSIYKQVNFFKKHYKIKEFKQVTENQYILILEEKSSFIE